MTWHGNARKVITWKAKAWQGNAMHEKTGMACHDIERKER
jgi:hypothetical protein